MAQPLIALNALLLTGEASYRSAGIAVYIVNLLRQLAQTDAQLDYHVLSGCDPFPADIPLPVTRPHWPVHSPARRIAWEQFAMPWVLKRLHASLLHAPAFVAPLIAPCPTVITVHDLSFMRYPQFFQRSKRLYLRTMTPLASRRAAAIIAGSDFARREIVSVLGVPLERVHVVPYGLSPRFRPLPTEEVARFRRRQGLPEQFILYLGTLEPRKNLPRLIRAFARLRMKDVHLVLAGGKGWFYQTVFDEVARLGLQERVHFPGFIPADTQALWYNAATVFAYLSTYEGFGLPVLESLACGVPAVTSNGTSLPEAAGGGALLISPNDEEAIAEALSRLLRDEDLRRTLRERGLTHAAQFSWAHTAHRTAQIFRDVLIQRENEEGGE